MESFAVSKILQQHGLNISFIPYKLSNYKSRIIIILLLFRKPDMSDEQFIFYAEGCRISIEHYSLSYGIRLYTDASILKYSHQSVEKLMRSISHNNIEVVEIYAPQFMDSNGYHIGTITTLLRLCPIHDWHICDRKAYIFLDIDYTEEQIKKRSIRHIVSATNKVTGSFFYGRVYDYFKFLNPRLTIASICDKIVFRQFANNIYTNYKFPKEPLIEFLHQLLTDDYTPYTQWYMGVAEMPHKDLFHMNDKYQFPLPYNRATAIGAYGIDELYLNKYILTHALDNTFVLMQGSLNYIHGIDYSLYIAARLFPDSGAIEILQKIYEIIEERPITVDQLIPLHIKYEEALYHKRETPAIAGYKKVFSRNDIIEDIKKLAINYNNLDLGAFLAHEMVKLKKYDFKTPATIYKFSNNAVTPYR